MSSPGHDIQSFTLSSILLRGEEVWNSLTKGRLNLSKGVFERRTSTRSRAEIGLSSVTLSSVLTLPNL